MVNLDMRSLQDHHPQEDDQVLAWLKERRDEYPEGSTTYLALGFLVEEYLDAARTMRSLEQMVNAEVYEREYVAGPPKQKKKRPVTDTRGI
jgi:hypothetical protein